MGLGIFLHLYWFSIVLTPSISLPRLRTNGAGVVTNDVIEAVPPEDSHEMTQHHRRYEDDDVPCQIHGSILPHFGDCQLFYVCVFGIRVPMSCAGGTKFDVTRNACAVERDAVCARRLTTTTTTTTTANPTTTEDEEEGSGDVSVIGPCFGLADGTQLPQPGKCAEFFVCVHGEAKPRRCASGTVFNPRKNKRFLYKDGNFGLSRSFGQGQ